MIEMVFNSGLKSDKDIIDMGFMLKWVEPNVFGVVTNKYDIIFKVIM